MRKVLILCVLVSIFSMKALAEDVVIVSGSSSEFCQQLAYLTARSAVQENAKIACGTEEVKMVGDAKTLTTAVHCWAEVPPPERTETVVIAKFRCVEDSRHCMPTCAEDGGDFVACHSKCGGW